MELVAIHIFSALFYEVQELSAKQCIMDIAAEGELSGNESQSCMKSVYTPWSGCTRGFTHAAGFAVPVSFLATENSCTFQSPFRHYP